MANTITNVKARQIFDSRGNPTVECEVTTGSGTFRAAVPSGASTGIYEALEMRDGGAAFMGKGVANAVANVNGPLKEALAGRTVEQGALDTFMVQELDGTKNEWGWCKSKLGANAILSVSLALARAGAAAAGVPLYRHIAGLAGRTGGKLVLPCPAFNVINGGSHAGNALACQEFMILPTGAASFAEAMQIGTEVYHNLKKVVKTRFGQDAVNVGDEGGFAPPIDDAEQAIQVIMEAIEKAGHAGKVQLGLDVAASEFYEDGKYDLGKWAEAENKVTAAELIDIYASWVEKYPIVSIEDAFDQDDWAAWAELEGRLGDKAQLVGDDLLVTNPTRVKRAIDEKSCNALLLKVNQIGSFTESVDAVLMSQRAGWGVMTSHRSGETEDTFIADLAVGLCTGQIKTGAPCRSERLAKYNQLLRIEEELGEDAVFAGANFRNPAAIEGVAPLPAAAAAAAGGQA